MIVNARTRSVGAETGPDVNKLLVAGAGVACRARLRTCNSELHSSEPRHAAVEFRWRKNSTSGEIQHQPAAAAAALCSGSFTSHFCASAQVFQGAVTTEYNRGGNRREPQGERMISMSPRSVDGCCSRQECGNNQLFSGAPACCHQARLASQSHTSFSGVMAALSGTRRKRRRSHLGALQLP